MFIKNVLKCLNIKSRLIKMYKKILVIIPFLLNAQNFNDIASYVQNSLKYKLAQKRVDILKEKLKEVDKMLRKINYENLPSYELGMEQGIADGLAKGFSQGISQGISQGVLQGQLETASMMIKEFNIPVDKIAQKLNISVDTIKEYLEKEGK